MALLTPTAVLISTRVIVLAKKNPIMNQKRLLIILHYIYITRYNIYKYKIFFFIFHKVLNNTPSATHIGGDGVYTSLMRWMNSRKIKTIFLRSRGMVVFFIVWDVFLGQIVKSGFISIFCRQTYLALILDVHIYV